MLTRRQIVIGSSCGVSAGIVAAPPVMVASAQEAIEEQLIDAFPPLPAEMGGEKAGEDFSGLVLDLEQLGTARPAPAEIEMAQTILEASPYDTTPLLVARHFQDLAKGALNRKFGADVRHFARGWPVKYNPIIINFFKATATDPLGLDGDFTSWCAAFINWCIARALSKTRELPLNDKGIMKPFDPALMKQGSRSASSGSFRCWPTQRDETDQPVPGDIVVWALKGSVSGCKIGKGHVGFFNGMNANGLFNILGGNQKDPNTKQFAVVEKAIGRSFSRSDGLVVFHSIRLSPFV